VLIYLDAMAAWPGRFVRDVAGRLDDHSAKAFFFPSVCHRRRFHRSAAAGRATAMDAATVLRDELAGNVRDQSAARHPVTIASEPVALGHRRAVEKRDNDAIGRPFHEELRATSLSLRGGSDWDARCLVVSDVNRFRDRGQFGAALT